MHHLMSACGVLNNGPKLLRRAGYALVTRPRWSAEVLPLSIGAHAALSALDGGATFGEAVDAAVAAEANFDVGHALSRWLQSGALVAHPWALAILTATRPNTQMQVTKRLRPTRRTASGRGIWGVSGAYLQRICEVSQTLPSSLRVLTMRQPCDTIRLLTGLCCGGFRIGSRVCPGYALAAPQIKRSLNADRTQI